MNSPLGASEEVLRHHAEQHGCPEDDSPPREVMCPCGTTVAIVCASCGDPVFICVKPGTWCQHATAASGDERPSGPIDDQ